MPPTLTPILASHYPWFSMKGQKDDKYEILEVEMRGKFQATAFSGDDIRVNGDISGVSVRGPSPCRRRWGVKNGDGDVFQ
jgi:hypothetical protein